ncbi:T-lymphocyte surface antigen Ly-9-like [Anabas testudineus]|uniref:T-lymphocyte surface antigen Ly-9-like n=1 Tax=Anabas testudineus TaxID=64144 RepID=UPI000E45823C|nr:T-lymphocyte surface antigen Ly-9-like [Anabas testudineus]
MVCCTFKPFKKRVSCSAVSHSLTLSGMKMFLLLSWWIVTGIAAENPPVVHYQLRNTSVCLHVRKSTSYKGSQWRFEKNVIAMDKITPNYTNKVDYFPGNFSLCIKELTDADSGTYTFSYVNSEYRSVSEEHRVIVQEMVPRPVIVTSVLHSNQSVGVCNISVNCSIQDDWLWSFCNDDSCRTTQKSLSKVNITISIENRTVVCSGNNHVSTNNASGSTAACFSASNTEHKDTSPSALLSLVAFPMCLLLVFIVFGAQKLSSTKSDQTSTAHLIQNQHVEVQTQPEPRASTSSSSQAEAAYENVDAICPSPSSSTRVEPGSMSSQKVDTVYSVLQAPKGSLAPGKSDRTKDMKGNQKTQEASASQSVTLRGAEHPVQIDTVYSMLQKPKMKPEVTAPPTGR